jgi:DNA-binding MarR family transcriptional regulator
MSYLEGFLGYALYWARSATVERVLETFAHHQITMSEFSVLMSAASNPGINGEDLSKAIGEEQSEIAAILNELEERGWVEQRELSRGRVGHIYLTKAGDQLARALMRHCQKHERKMLARLDAKEAEMLLSGLRKLAVERSAAKKRGAWRRLGQRGTGGRPSGNL